MSRRDDSDRRFRAIAGDGGTDDVTNELDPSVWPGDFLSNEPIPLEADDSESVSIDRRILQRRRQVQSETKRKGRRRLLWVLAALIAVTVGVVAVFTPVLGIDRITIRGVDSRKAKLIRAATSDQIGRTAVFVDESAIRARVGAIPGIADVQVSVSWPRELRIVATALRPVAYAATVDGSVASIDAEGTVLTISSAVPQDLVRLDGAVVTAAVGADIPDEFLDSLAVAERLSARLTSNVVSVSQRSGVGSVLRLEPTGQVLVGDTSDLDLKMSSIETLLSGKVVLGCLETIDVRVPKSATITRNDVCTGKTKKASTEATSTTASEDETSDDPTRTTDVTATTDGSSDDSAATTTERKLSTGSTNDTADG